MRPYMLDCEDLSGPQTATVHKKFVTAMIAATKAVAVELSRPPSQHEFDMLRRCLTDHFNRVVIPAVAAGEG